MSEQGKRDDGLIETMRQHSADCRAQEARRQREAESLEADFKAMSEQGKSEAINSGDLVDVGIQSWAGLTWHRARVVRVCPKRFRVFWLDCGRRHGSESYVPKAAVQRVNP